jgi:hypothetical protein
MRTIRFVGLSLTLMTVAAVSVLAQEIPVEGPAPTTATISVESKKGAALDPAMLNLQVNRQGSSITAVNPVKPGGLQIAILIDDGLRGSFGLQVDELKKFIAGLPVGAKVMVGYMQNGGVRAEGGFTADHEAVESQLRLPLSAAGISASPYFCLSEFVKHWPSNEAAARVVLMLTNGVDPYNGSTSMLNQDSPYVQRAQDDAQRAGVAVYSIYYGDSGFRGARGSFSGQGYLQQVAQATGGQTYNQGTIAPPSIGPFLSQFQKALAESYTVSFMASVNREKNDTLTSIKLTTKQPGVKIYAPEAVHPGVVE